MTSRRAPLLHESTPRHPAGASDVGAVGARERFDVTLVLRRDPGAALSPAASVHARHGATDADLAATLAFAARHDLRVVRRSAARREVVVSGTARALQRAFDVELRRFDHPRGAYHGHDGPIHVPAPLVEVVRSVLGLDRIPLFHRPTPRAHREAQALHSVRAVARAYGVPRGTGLGHRIALLEFGGGYRVQDLDAFFSMEGVARPLVRALRVLGARNAPAPMHAMRHLGRSAPDDQVMCTVETTMDIEVAGAIAPGAAIDVLFAPNDARGYHAAILQALGLGHGAGRQPAAQCIAISWGMSEAEWSPHAMQAIEDALQRAFDMGVAVCCASGDHGSRATDRPARLARVSFPASSPHVLACGGTSLRLTGDGRVRSESAWNSVGLASGGGMSGVFARPAWQRGVDLRDEGDGAWVSPVRDRPFDGRCVPDVSANADPRTGFAVIVGGQTVAGCGTSAAAPFWAGLLAVLGERLGRPVGPIAPLLYRTEFRHALRGLTGGDNKVPGPAVRYFRAHAGWDACTGLGAPRADRLLDALQG